MQTSVIEGARWVFGLRGDAYAFKDMEGKQVRVGGACAQADTRL